jgi:hypothetical protein
MRAFTPMALEHFAGQIARTGANAGTILQLALVALV